MQKWNQINKRLKTIIADGLDISFNHSPVVKKTFRNTLAFGFFHVKLNGQIIWEYPKDNAYHNFRFQDTLQPYDRWERPWQGGQEKPHKFFADGQFSSPENIIAGYLDIPKDKLLEFDEPTGIRYILWACDKRIGKQRLSELQFIKQAMPIIQVRLPEYNSEPCLGNSMTLVYTDDVISIFGKSKWAFDCTFDDDYYNTHRFIVTDNPSYSLSKHAIEIDFNGNIAKLSLLDTTSKLYSKNILNITPEIEEKIISALKSKSINIENKTVWEEIITLENLYPTTKEAVPEDYPLFTAIKN